MTAETSTYKNVAPLRNVSALLALVNRVQERSFSLPGMGTFHGPSGYGKSTALVYTAIKTGGVSVQVKSAWTRKAFCEAILTEMAVTPAKNIASMVEQISEHLAVTGLPLLIDEADHLMKNSMIELVRDIYEGSGAAVILIGEELLPQKLRQWERVHNRMLDWVAAEPASLSDVGHLAKIYARDISVEDDLQKLILEQSRHNTRRVCVNLERVQEFALRKGLETVGRAEWGTNALFTGTAPGPRFRKAGAGSVA
jgi:DNA transposition AAA+ family ATPase